jgi:hypothetical protein
MTHDAYAEPQGLEPWQTGQLTGFDSHFDDDSFIAHGIDRGLRAAGARAVGRFGEMIFPVTEKLQRRGVPPVFTTGGDGHMIPAAFDGCRRAVR